LRGGRSIRDLTKDQKGLTKDPKGLTKDPKNPTKDQKSLTKDQKGDSTIRWRRCQVVSQVGLAFWGFLGLNRMFPKLDQMFPKLDQMFPKFKD
jgi:hypothetical protein